ncbi:MAG: hypothetical protein GEV09_16865 [Pseudonocardiaceae bacterium]|nr:hypothetical protein [Pseudonocardiaceae bacterium]
MVTSSPPTTHADAAAADNGEVRPAASVVIEVLAFRLDGNGWLACRDARVRWQPPAEPDELALRTAGITRDTPEWTVSHSTSWRYDPAGVLVLTYALAPDPDPQQPAVALPRAGVLCSGDPLHPRPEALHAHHVAAHAVRHLAHLAVSDPTVRDAASHRPELWRVIADAGAAMAVGSHTEIHARRHEA